jgi:hypothetical protein
MNRKQELFFDDNKGMVKNRLACVSYFSSISSISKKNPIARFFPKELERRVSLEGVIITSRGRFPSQ